MTPSHTTGRRGFLASAAGAGTLLLNPLAWATAEAQVQGQSWDLGWVDQLGGEYKQVFDTTTLQNEPLGTVVNFLNAFEDVLGVRTPAVTAIIGVTGALPLVASDDLWSRYALGEKWRARDPATGQFATRNIYRSADGDAAGPRAATVEALQRRGVIFWQCNNALNFVADMLAKPANRPTAEVRGELVGGLLPGVKLVPAHTMLLNLVQRRGCSYQQV